MEPVLDHEQPTMGTKAASEILGIPQARLSKMCKDGKIEGAYHDGPGSPWHIPVESVYKMKAQSEARGKK